MDETRQTAYEKGLLLFEEQQYDEAMKCFVEAYETGVMQKEIIQLIYDCFITPNEVEFRESYQSNNQGFSKLGYDDLPIDFVPVTEHKFYLFERVEASFLGIFEMEEAEIPWEGEIESLMIADTWDIRSMLPIMRQKRWSTVYIVLEGYEKWFLSFLKLPNFFQRYLENVVIFSSRHLMQIYFETYTQYYLPRSIFSANFERDQAVIDRLHAQRVQDAKNRPRENILLSICIMSWNRGESAWRSVTNILQSKYDSEIEVIISNNGSDSDIEGYERIKNFKDCRVKYFAFEENQGYATNVRNVLAMADGKFAMLASDEDFLILEQLPSYLSYLIRYQESGVIKAAGYGCDFPNDSEKVFLKGYESVQCAINMNYVTGITLNMEWFRRCQVLQKFDSMRGNLFLEYYAHIGMALILSKEAEVRNSGIYLWSQGEENLEGGAERPPVLSYMRAESRLAQQNGSIELLERFTDLNSMSFLQMVVSRIWKTYGLLELAYTLRSESFARESRWLDACIIVHKGNMQLLSEKFDIFSEKEKLASEMINAFYNAIAKNPLASIQSEQEQLRQQILSNLILYKFRVGRRIEDIDLDALEAELHRMLEKKVN